MTRDTSHFERSPLNSDALYHLCPSKKELKDAFLECLRMSQDYSKGSRGPIGSWDVSSVTDMDSLFEPREKLNSPMFNADKTTKRKQRIESK